MSPFTSGPQDNMGFMQAFGFSQSPFVPSLQYGQSPMDNTPGGQHPLDHLQYGPSYIDPTQHALTISEIHERAARQSANATRKLTPIFLSHARNSSIAYIAHHEHLKSRPEGKEGQKQRLCASQPTPLVRCAKDVKSLHPTSAERRARAGRRRLSPAPL